MAQRLGIKVEAPNINRSAATFEVGDNTIYYALAALKGVGPQAVELIVEERRKGVFTSLADFAARVNPRAINKRVIESLRHARLKPRPRLCRGRRHSRRLPAQP